MLPIFEVKKQRTDEVEKSFLVRRSLVYFSVSIHTIHNMTMALTTAERTPITIVRDIVAIILSFLHRMEHWFYKDWPKEWFLSLTEVQIWSISLEAAPYPGPETKLQSCVTKHLTTNNYIKIYQISPRPWTRLGSVSQYISVTFELCKMPKSAIVWQQFSRGMLRLGRVTGRVAISSGGP